MRAHRLISGLLLAGGAFTALTALAQPSPAPAPATPTAPLARDETPPSRFNQRIEHLRTEDAGARVDELRTGGETRSITVQPAAEVPPYQVQPADGARPETGPREAGPGGAGRRVWNVIQF
ncbi:MAG: hypothetical protein LCH89_14445 [Proteobacteria bacterium]|jgi:hypothetical protein|nr:hypothetical protein [Pseudomonadota bacterium]